MHQDISKDGYLSTKFCSIFSTTNVTIQLYNRVSKDILYWTMHRSIWGVQLNIEFDPLCVKRMVHAFCLLSYLISKKPYRRVLCHSKTPLISSSYIAMVYITRKHKHTFGIVFYELYNETPYYVTSKCQNNGPRSMSFYSFGACWKCISKKKPFW